jgi:hypothetical protein
MKRIWLSILLGLNSFSLLSDTSHSTTKAKKYYFQSITGVVVIIGITTLVLLNKQQLKHRYYALRNNSYSHDLACHRCGNSTVSEIYRADCGYISCIHCAIIKSDHQAEQGLIHLCATCGLILRT